MVISGTDYNNLKNYYETMEKNGDADPVPQNICQSHEMIAKCVQQEIQGASTNLKSTDLSTDRWKIIEEAD